MKKIILTAAIIVTAAAILGGCGFSFGSQTERYEAYTKNGKLSDDITVDGKSLRKLTVTNGVGMINITGAKEGNAEIHYKETIKGFGADVDKILEQTLVKARVDGDLLTVSVRTKDGDEDFWHWLSDHHKGINVSIDFDIKVPDNFNEFTVTDGVGDISFSGREGKYTVTGGVGDIRLENASLADKCTITNGTGNIGISGDIYKLSGLTIKSGVGDTSLRLPEDSKFSIDAATGVGSIEGNLVDSGDGFVGDSLNQDVNGGGAGIEIKTGTGDIKVNKK